MITVATANTPECLDQAIVKRPGRFDRVVRFPNPEQKDVDHYETIGKISTRGGAGTSFWSPELDRYYVAAPRTGKEQAAILVYAPED